MVRKPSGFGKYNNPGNARWCEEHGRLECTKNRRAGRGPCHKMATRGTNACDLHSGYSRAVTRAQGEARITAWNAQGQNPNIDAGMAVLGVLQMTWLRLSAYSELLRRQVVIQGDEADQVDLDDADFSNASGLIGYRYGAAGKDGNIYRQTEEVRALVMLEAAERDRVVKYAKTAHDMGISKRLTELAEKWGDVVAVKIATMLDALELSPEQASRVPMLLESHLGAIDMNTIEGQVTD